MIAAPAPPRSAPPRAEAPAGPDRGRSAAPPRLLMTRAEFEAAGDCPGTRVEWLGVSDETRDGEPLGVVWPVRGFHPDGSFAMASPVHSEIVVNLVLLLGGLIDRDVWKLMTQDCEVGLPTGRIRLPDVVLARRPAVHAPPRPGGIERILLNPAVAFEVLSDSTERVDLEDKPADYLSVPTMTDYVAIDPERARVLHHRRADATPARWDVTPLTDLAAAVSLADLAGTLPLAEIYRRVL